MILINFAGLVCAHVQSVLLAQSRPKINKSNLIWDMVSQAVGEFSIDT